MREYETLYLLNPEMPSDKAEDLNKKILDAIVSQGGHVLTSFNWGKRRLAYRIEKSAYGVYVYVNFLGINQLVAEVERILKYDDNVFRFVTMKLEDDVNVEERKNEKREPILTSIDEPSERSHSDGPREYSEVVN